MAAQVYGCHSGYPKFILGSTLVGYFLSYQFNVSIRNQQLPCNIQGYACRLLKGRQRFEGLHLDWLKICLGHLVFVVIVVLGYPLFFLAREQAVEG